MPSELRKSKIRRLLLIAGVAALAGVLFLCAFYLALRYEPAFYRKALTADPEALEKASDRMLQKTAALAGALKKKGHWEALFTAEQINGWLAVDLVKNHPDVLPSALRDPRVAIGPRCVTLACRFQRGGVDGVLSLTVEPYVPEPNVIALRIVSARVGLLPAPRGQVIEQLAKAAQAMHIGIQWRRSGGDPVALLTMAPGDVEPPYRIESLRLGDGEIFLAGAAEEQTH